MQKENKKGIVGQVITYIFAIVGLVLSVLGIVLNSGGNLLEYIVTIIIFVLILVYAIFGYKKPHGNMLRWTMLLYAALRIIAIAGLAEAQIDSKIIVLAVSGLSALCVGYMSGRLNKGEKNLYWLYIAGALELIGIIIMLPNATNFLEGVAMFTSLFAIIALFGAYYARYDEHKNAGAEEK